MPALLDEFLAALETANEADFAALAAAGVGDAALLRLPIPGVVGAAPVRPLAGGLYEPAGEGAESAIRAWIFPTNLLGTVRHATPEDLIAIAQRPPHRWRLRLGAATVLGAHEIERRSFAPARAWHRDVLDGPTEEPLALWQTPLAWLKAGCRGAVVLDWPAAAFDLLGIWTAIVAEDVGHGLDIRRRLRRPVPCPPIRVPAGKEAA
ncbi:MAG: hypothetical protein IH626_02175 [Rhodospirillales bacterium]|nr:hypothetical protein [Rhodospirillales bacterium]